MPGRRRNLEIKAIDPDPHATLRAALELGAEDAGWLHQRDTYFHAVQGRLKLREAPPEPAELEAVAASPGGLEVERDRVEELRAALGIADEHLVAHGYADLLTRRSAAGFV